MRVIELFAGVGGFRLGLERAGHEVVWANEWDKYAAKTYDKNFGGSIDTRDITKIPAEEIPEHELICGGFPCQSFSVAGKRGGFGDTRGTLFFDILRIARHHHTPYLLLENVKGLLNHDGGRTFEVILRSLDESGYDVQWQVLNSKDFGVPQNRERVIIIANLRDRPRPQIFPLTRDERQVSEAGGDAGGGAEAFIKTRHLSQNGSLISKSITLQASETPHILQRPRGKNDGGVYDTAPTVQQGMRDGNIVLANTLRASDGGATDRETLVAAPDARIRRLTPVECERLQGFPDNWTAGVSDNQRYKQMGNAVTVNVIEAVAGRLER